jgi:hypothetical protein
MFGAPIRRCGDTEEMEVGIGTCEGTKSGSS